MALPPDKSKRKDEQRIAKSNVSSSLDNSREDGTIDYLDEAKKAQRARQRQANKKYGRGDPIQVQHVKDKKLRSNLQSLENRYQEAALKASEAEILEEHDSLGFLEPENELEKTWRVRQSDIVKELPVSATARKLDLKLLQLGPYIAEFTRDSRGLLLAGKKGHVASFDWRSGKLGFEIQLGESVRDATWLANGQHVAVAQKKYVYIYDRNGVEIHNLQKHIDVTAMQYLPYHFLLATIGNAGYLKYMDVTEGRMVAEIRTKVGSPTAFRQNPWNAIIFSGDRSGNVSLYSPSSPSYLAKIHSHAGPCRSIAIDRTGKYMVSAGQDQSLVLTDLRMTHNEPFREVQRYHLPRPGTSLDVSDSGLVACAWGSQLSIYKDMFLRHQDDQVKASRPYMTGGGGREGSSGSQQIERVRFCPFEDILGISHQSGFSTMIVPGAGTGFDALEVNPFETTPQRQESEVRKLLEKLQPETISLNPDFIGKLDLASAEIRKKEKDLDRPPEDPLLKLKNRGKGRNSSLRKLLRKKGSRNIIDDQRLRVQELYESQKKSKQQQKEQDYGLALARFARRPKSNT